MADRSTHSTSTSGTGSSSNKSSGAPAWKLREQMKQKQQQGGGGAVNKPKRTNSSKYAKKATKVDPNLPPAFRAVAMQRLAFDRQQARRKNNDEFVSLNSTHVNKEATQDEMDDMSSLGSELSFGDSFGELEEGDEEE